MPAALAPFNAHLALIKRRLLIIGVSIMIFFALAFTYSGALIEWFSRPFADTLIFYGPTEALFAAIKVSFLAGIVLSLPVILYQCWKFIEPALLPKEQRLAIPIIVLAAGLFGLGLAFCNLVILPLVIQFFVGFGMERGLSPQLAVGVFVDFNVKFLLVMGVAFELPLVLSLLARAGYVSAEILGRHRKHAALIALIVSAVVTPDATAQTMLLMAVPLIVLYEIGIVGARVFGRRPPPKQAGASQDQPGAGGTEDEAVPTGTAGYRAQ